MAAPDDSALEQEATETQPMVENSHAPNQARPTTDDASNGAVDAPVVTGNSQVPQPTDEAVMLAYNASSKSSAQKPNFAYTGPYDIADYQFDPNPNWPPPVFIRQNAPPQERFYIENRWYSQWSYFDKRANENKRRYFSVQLFIGVGSVIVPSLVSLAAFNGDSTFRSGLDLASVVISLGIAIAATLESLNQYGEFWRSYRQAAEELQAEKTYYDMRSGLYNRNADPFSTFVQRCEEIMAKQNGRFIQSVERQQAEAEEQVDTILNDYRNTGDETSRTASAKTAAPAG